MNELSSRSCLVYDTGGQNVATALRLAKEFGRVFYATKFSRGFDRLPEACPGMGFSEIEWVYDPFNIHSELLPVKPDLWVFPDCFDAGLQLYLEEKGERVWGSRNGSVLEHKRKFFLDTVQELGLDVPDYQEVVGLSALKRELELPGVYNECFVKCSYWRGSVETHHHINMELSRTWFTHLEKELGGLVEKVPFVIIEPVDSVTEVGYDGYCVDGEFPELSMQGIEVKDRTYIGTVSYWNDLPEQVRAVNDTLAEYLRKVRYRNRWSTEIRITDGDGFYFLDPTCRIPSPAGEAQLANEENTGEIYWEGAAGNLVQPIYRKPFAVQLVIQHEDEMCEWRTLSIPEEVRDSVYLKYACKVDGAFWIPPQTHDAICGWVVGLGDTIQQAIDEATATAKALQGQSLKINPESLAESLKAVQEQEKAGIEFTPEPVPEPESVVKND